MLHPTPAEFSADDGWSAQLQLAFAPRAERTVLTRNRHQGPLRVQRAFYPEANGCCHVYLLHPPGGVVAGDSIAIEARVEAGAHGLITTPSAGRIYRTNQQGWPQTQRVDLKVAGFGEWLPQETIVFNSANAINHTRIELTEEAQFNGWEVVVLGRPAAQEAFLQGQFQQRLEVFRNEQPLLLEPARFKGGTEMLHRPWGLNGATAMGTLITTCTDEKLLQLMRTLCDDFSQQGGPALAGVTRLPELTVVRALAPQSSAIKNLFMALWHRIRLQQLQQPAQAPRIWFT